MTCPRSPSKSPLSSLRLWESLLSPLPPPGCLTRTLWTWLGPAASGSVFPGVRSVDGQGWKVGRWDHLGFCPTLTGPQMPQPSPPLKQLTWIPEAPHGYLDAAPRASTPQPGPARTLFSRKVGSQKGEPGRQTHFHYPLPPLSSISFPPSSSLPLLLCPFSPPPHCQAAPASHQAG